MTSAALGVSQPLGSRRGVAASAVALLLCIAACIFSAPSGASDPRATASQPLVILLADHIVRAKPNADAHRLEAVASRRPLTRVRTVLPVLGRAGGKGEATWLRVRLPGRPNGHTGWISTQRTKSTSTEWSISVRLSARRVSVYRNGRLRRQFRAVVGKPSTPTPRGRFFIEEALALSSSSTGGPFALASSARSHVLREFEGGPGQVALHGTDNLSGELGSAVSHGCIRLGTRAINWMARRLGAGVPLTIRR